LDEGVVTGDIDQAELDRVSGGILKIEKREAEIDGDTAGFFFRQAVCVGAGEGIDECGFAVVNVAGGA
jgi:hypothetical protein